MARGEFVGPEGTHSLLLARGELPALVPLILMVLHYYTWYYITYMHMRRRIHAYEEEDTCIRGGGYMHMRRRIHAYEEEDTCICGGGYMLLHIVQHYYTYVQPYIHA